MMPTWIVKKKGGCTVKINNEMPRYAVINEDGTYAGIFCTSLEEARELASNGSQPRYIFELKEVTL